MLISWGRILQPSSFKKYEVPVWGFPGGSDGKEYSYNAGDPGLIPKSGRSPGEGNGYPLVFLPGEFHGQRTLEGYSPWGCKELDMTEQLSIQHTGPSLEPIFILSPISGLLPLSPSCFLCIIVYISSFSCRVGTYYVQLMFVFLVHLKLFPKP